MAIFYQDSQPTASSQYSGGGSEVWIDTAGIHSSGGTAATVTLTPFEETYVLVGTNFGFTIPTDATILGVVLFYNTQQTASFNDIKFGAAWLRNSGGQLGTIRLDTQSWSKTGAYSSQTFGGGSDLWDYALTPAILNDTTFGVECYAHNASSSTAGTGYVDYLNVRVWYDAPVKQSRVMFIGV